MAIRESESEYLQRALDAVNERYAKLGDELDEAESRIIDLQNELEADHDGHETLYTEIEAIVQRLTQEHIFAHRKDAVMWCQEPACSVLRSLVSVL